MGTDVSKNTNTNCLYSPLIAQKQVVKYLNVPGFAFEYNKGCKNILDDNSCCICYHDYRNGMIMHMLPCNHIIHRKCLYEWCNKSNTCPICRAVFTI